MPKKRRLSDLYILEKKITVDDGEGGVDVIIRKLNPVEHESAMRRANAERARVLTLKNFPESDEYRAIYNQVLDLSEQPTLVDYVAGQESAQQMVNIEEELAAEDEWSKDGYLQGLRDAWEGGLEKKYASDPEDPEVLRVLEELRRFSGLVEKEFEERVKDIRAKYEHLAVSELQQKVMTQLLEIEGELAWMKEFRRCEVWFSTRDPEDSKKYYFQDREEVSTLSLPVLEQLMTAYRELTVDVTEGKDSEETPSSSPSVEQPTKVETGVSSGLKVVAE